MAIARVEAQHGRSEWQQVHDQNGDHRGGSDGRGRRKKAVGPLDRTRARSITKIIGVGNRHGLSQEIVAQIKIHGSPIMLGRSHRKNGGQRVFREGRMGGSGKQLSRKQM
ncbi:hypothetical protein SUGI_0931370 [Cryptomeria japonica]|nr:hypothetical protein SUGI_0931370 [Cryptomeria japonica]